jgi:hypothetical protein
MDETSDPERVAMGENLEEEWTAKAFVRAADQSFLPIPPIHAIKS